MGQIAWGGNSLLGTVVFGKIAGRESAVIVEIEKKKTIKGRISPELRIADPKEKEFASTLFIVEDAHTIRGQVQQIMEENAGIVKDGRKLQKGRKKILELKKAFCSKNYHAKDLKNYRNLVRTWEAKSALLVSEAVIKSALMRQESRELTTVLTSQIAMIENGK